MPQRKYQARRISTAALLALASCSSTDVCTYVESPDSPFISMEPGCAIVTTEPGARLTRFDGDPCHEATNELKLKPGERFRSWQSVGQSFHAVRFEWRPAECE